jgi:hypothetical protein
MTAKQVVEKWVEFFNRIDIEGISELYHDDVINQYVLQGTFLKMVIGRSQRGYWDRLSFLRQQGLPLPKKIKACANDEGWFTKI